MLVYFPYNFFHNLNDNTTLIFTLNVSGFSTLKNDITFITSNAYFWIKGDSVLVLDTLAGMDLLRVLLKLI